MRLLFGCCVAGLCLLLCVGAKSQPKQSVIKGQLALQDNIVAEAATIVLIKLRDSSIAGHATVKPTGNFEFNNVKPDDYVVRITYTGFINYVSTPFTVADATINLPPINLIPSPTGLKEITIANKKSYIETHGDRTVLNVEKSIMASGINMLDVLNTAPGVRVSQSGEILFKGGQKAAIAINGRVINLSSQDLAAQLQNMQTSNVAQVELINNPSAKYDAAGAGGLINIILEKGQNEGLNLTATEMAGYGNFGKLGSSINFNYGTKKLNFFGSYNFGTNNTDHTIITNRTIGSNTNFDVDYYNRQKSFTHTYTFGVDYNIDDAHTLSLFLVGYYYNYFLNKRTQSGMANFGKLDSTLITTSTLNRRMGNNDYTITYNGKLGHTDQTLFADVDYFNFNRNANEDLSSILINNQNNVQSAPLYFTNYAPTHISNLSSLVCYTNTLSSTAKFEFGIKTIFAVSDNTQQFDNVVNGIHHTNNTVSSQFNYTENVSSGYATYTKKISEKVNYILGLRAEHTESDANTLTETYRIKRSYTDLFPSVAFNWMLNANNQLSLTYNRRVSRPGYQELNPIIAYQDKYDFTAGNAYLRPSYTDKIELKHTYLDNLVTSLYASFTRDDYNFTYFTQNDATGVFTAGKTNLKQVRALGADITVPFAPTEWWAASLSANASYIHYEDYAGKLNKGTFDATFKLTQQFRLPAGFAVAFDGYYEVPNFYYIYQYKSSYIINSGIRKSLLKDMATLSLTAEDLFNTMRDRYSTTYANLNLNGYDKKETQIFRVTFAYKFGKNILPGKHVTGNSDELKRLIP